MSFRRLCLIAAVAGCSTGTPAEPGMSAGSPRGASVDPRAPEVGAGITGLPCDVADVLSRSCATCHGRPPTSRAPMSMLTYEDMTAPSPSDGARRVVELAIERMKDARRPMPPSGASATERAVFESWLADGLPRAACAASVGEPPASGYDTPTVCTSNTRAGGRDGESPLMHPGVGCIACHGSAAGEAPSFTIAGTVYPTAHEPDECHGTSSAITVVITDANGETHALPTNAAGNFFMSSPFAGPYRAKVVAGSRERAMATPQTSGDCNACHTERGASAAPGRIVAP